MRNTKTHKIKIVAIDHFERDGCMYIRMHCGSRAKTTEKKMPGKTLKDKNVLQKKDNNLLPSYACPSTDVNLLFETVSGRSAFL